MSRRNGPRNNSRRVLSGASAVAVALAVALVASAGARTPSAGAVGGGVEPLAHVIHQPGAILAPARLARSTVSWNGGPTIASTGETVNVFVSAALPAELGTAQTWADFLAGLLHGPELSSLTASIATFEEMQGICGEYALGCYGPNEMVSMGEPMFGVTADEVVRHEYGHHIAFHRLNSPWRAIDWGPKNWSSAANVCRRAEDGSAYPGDEGDNYSLNPGEAWAETYRLLDERKAGMSGSDWPLIDESFYPDDSALGAAERDVLQPWSLPKISVARHVFTQQGKRVWTIPVQTQLDGAIDVTVKLARNGLDDVVLLGDRKNVLAEGLWSSASTKRITSTVCGQRSLVLRVTHKGGFGPVKVVTRVP